jgi:hypothetical protein
MEHMVNIISNLGYATSYWKNPRQVRYWENPQQIVTWSVCLAVNTDGTLGITCLSTMIKPSSLPHQIYVFVIK